MGHDPVYLKVAFALEHLIKARDLLAAADCPKTLERVRLAISSCKGARRNAEHRADRENSQRRFNRAFRCDPCNRTWSETGLRYGERTAVCVQCQKKRRAHWCTEGDSEVTAERAARAKGWTHGGDCGGFIYDSNEFESWKAAASADEAATYETWVECCRDQQIFF